MDFPISGVNVSPFIPPVVAFVISFFTSMGGVSGAFLLLPFQMSFLGYTSPSVSATNQVFNIVAIPSGVWRFIREGRMVWPLTWLVVIGTLPGVLIGAVVRVLYLPDPRAFKLFAGLVLLYIGSRLVRDLLKPSAASSGKTSAEGRFQSLVRRHQSSSRDSGRDLPTTVVKKFGLSQVIYEFYGERFEVSTLAVTSLSFVVGIIGGIYGIGGGAIIAPFFVAILGLPVYTVAGAALMGTFVTSVAGVGFYHAIAPLIPEHSIAPDWSLGLLFGIGGMAGMYLGARAQKFVPARLIKVMLSIVIVLTATRYVFGFFW